MHMVRDDNELESHLSLTPSLLGMFFLHSKGLKWHIKKTSQGNARSNKSPWNIHVFFPIKMVDFPWRHVSLRNVTFEFSWGGGKREMVVGSSWFSIWMFPKIMVSQNGWWKSWKTHYFRKHPYLRSSPINFFYGNFVILTLRLSQVLAVCQYVSQHTRLNFWPDHLWKNQNKCLRVVLVLVLAAVLVVAAGVVAGVVVVVVVVVAAGVVVVDVAVAVDVDVVVVVDVDAGVAVVFCIVLGVVVLLSLLFLLLLLLPLLMLLLRRQLPQNPATERIKPCFKNKSEKFWIQIYNLWLSRRKSPTWISNSSTKFPTRTRWKTRQSLVS